MAAPTLYHHQWRRPRHRPSPQRRRDDNTNSGTVGAPAPAFDFSVPTLEPSTAAGNGRPGLLPEHPLLGRHTAYGGASQRRRTLAATDPRGAGSSQGAGGGTRAWRWRRPSMAAEWTRRWRRQTAHRGRAAAPRAKGQQRRLPATAHAVGIQGRRRPPRGGSGAPPEIRRRRFKGQERVPNRNPVPSFFLGQTGPFLGLDGLQAKLGRPNSLHSVENIQKGPRH